MDEKRPNRDISALWTHPQTQNYKAYQIFAGSTWWHVEAKVVVQFQALSII